MKKIFENSSEKIGIVAPKMESLIDVSTYYAWKLPRFSDNILLNFILLKKILGNPLAYKDDIFEHGICKVEVVPGSLFMIIAKTIQDINYFDEDTFLYGEEDILAFKLKEKGYVNYILNDMNYIHIHSVGIMKNITSVRKRLEILHQSKKIYNNKYLKVSKFSEVLFEITYLIGINNYCIAIYIKKIINSFRKK